MQHCRVCRDQQVFTAWINSVYKSMWVFSLGMLKIHSGGSSSQQTVLTIPANQLKQLGVGTGSGGLQTILMPVGKGKCD